MASCEVLDFFKGRKLIDGLLKKLNVTLISDGVLNYAEEKQIAKLALKEWLNELKDAVYKAEDFLDEIAYGAPRMEMKAGRLRSSEGQLRNLVSFLNPLIKGRKEIEKKLELILANLEYLVKQKYAFGLREGVGEKQSAQKIQTISLVYESGFLFRDSDEEAVLELFLSNDADGNNPCGITIIGMGGVGKTTIAQFVFNDNKVKECFDI